MGETLETKGSPHTLNTINHDLTSGDFVSFWQKFRVAVLSFDTTKIFELTQFPFQTRGPLDSDPTIVYAKKNFVPMFKAFLNQWNGQDLNGKSELDTIKELEFPNKNDIQNDQARIGDLRFKKVDKNWKLTFAYLNNETIDSLKK